MSTIQQIRVGLEAELAEFDRLIESDKSEVRALLASAESQGRNNLTQAEDTRAEALMRSASAAQAARARKASALARAIEIETEENQQELRLNSTRSTATPRGGKPAYDQVMRIGSEPRTYRSQAERNGGGDEADGFIGDLYRSQILGDPSASERIARHGREMAVDNPRQVERAVGSGGVPGFLPPAYLAELFAVYARAGRPTANLCRKLPLPAQGMTVNIPKVSTPSKTQVQAAENAVVGNQDPAATLLTANVNTVAGYVTVSRQAVERGPMTEEIIASDLAADYNMQLDAQVLNGSGVAGQHLGILGTPSINAVTYTAASPVLVGAATPMWPKLASAIGQVMSGRFAGPNAMVLSPNEWAWMLAATDPSTNRPIIQPNQQGGAFNPAGVLDGPPAYQGVAGYIFNLPVYLDGSMPSNLGVGTNETRIIVADFDDLILFEDDGGAPSQLRFEQPAGSSLGIMLVAYGYSAFVGNRQPKAISVLSGTGLITPAL